MSNSTTPGLRDTANSLVQRLTNIKAGLISVSNKLAARPPTPAPGNAVSQNPGQSVQILPALADSTGVAHALVDDVEAILHEIEALL